MREEARALVLEMNETADRNVSLVEDRMVALRELLVEADRRIVLGKKELATRGTSAKIYAKLNKRRPIVPSREAAPSGTTVPSSTAEQSGSTAPRKPRRTSPFTLGLGRAETSSAVPGRRPR